MSNKILIIYKCRLPFKMLHELGKREKQPFRKLSIKNSMIDFEKPNHPHKR